MPQSSGCNHFENMTENVHVCFEVHIEKKLKTLTINKKVSLFVSYISDTVGRNFASQVHTVIQKVFIRNVSLRFYAESKFWMCFEVHIPVVLAKLCGEALGIGS